MRIKRRSRKTANSISDNMPSIDTNRKIGIFAQSNAGKTYLVMKLIRYICSNGDNVAIYDTDHMDRNKYDFSGISGCYVFNPAIGKEDNPTYLNKWLLAIKASKRPGTKLFVFIDDIDSFFDEHNANAFDFGELKNLASKGRHQGIGILYASKFTSWLPTQLIQNTNLFYIGAFPNEKSFKKLEAIVKFAEIKALDFSKHEFLEIDVDNNFKKRVVIA